MSGPGYMVSSPTEDSRMPGSPTKSSLQRGSATFKHSRSASTVSPFETNGGEADRGRTRSKVSPQPGKENFPLASEVKGKAEGKSKISILRGLSPERKASAEPKGRSLSPSKRDKHKQRGEEGMQAGGCNPTRSTKDIDEEFVNMLGEMEVPALLRQKLMTMDSHVKASMMKGQATLSLAALSAATSGKSRLGISDRLRKSKSSGSIMADGSWEEVEMMSPPNRSALFGGGPQSRSTSGNSTTSNSSTEGRGAGNRGSHLSPSLQQSPSFVPLSGARSRTGSFSSAGLASMSNNASASSFATMLKTTDSSRLDVARVKKMRAVLSSESPTWIGEFVEQGGYSALVVRLNEVLNLEWREEQHDDQLLHELLRCFAALSTTDRGRATLQSMAPTPFVQLSCLLFSEKRPGDLSTRKVLVELLILLAELPLTRMGDDLGAVESARESSTTSSALSASPSTPPAFLLLLLLLHNLRDPSQESKVDFIKASHAPRPFKTFVAELLGLNRDYFWVFCHSNRFWSLKDINIDEVECPKVPGGMTGGVEFEAMAYLTSLLRLLNAICSRLVQLSKREKNRAIAWDFHSLLFSSGLERALLMTRKASQTYYQPLHLELARYFDHARLAHFQIPAELEAWQSTPQLLTTEHRYHHPSARSAAPDPSLTPVPAPSDPSRRAMEQQEDRQPTATTADVRQGQKHGNTGQWIGARGRGQTASPREVEGPSSFEGVALGSRLPNPHSDPSEEAGWKGPEQSSRGDAHQTPSMVGNAVMQWERLVNNAAGPNHQGGLGLGWAPPR